jgi:hypothetical protein
MSRNNHVTKIIAGAILVPSAVVVGHHFWKILLQLVVPMLILAMVHYVGLQLYIHSD